MKNDRLYLEHILGAITDIRDYVSQGHDIFMGERMRQDAVIRKLEIIGEAVKNLSEGCKTQHPEIPWRRIAGMRDRLTHAYFGVDLTLVRAVVDAELPTLQRTVEQALSGLAN